MGEGRVPWSPSFGYAYAPSEENKKGVRKVFARFLAFSNKISTVQKVVLSSSRGQGNFRGLVASRPRPRTFKMCPRGQRRPRGLHLWLRIRLVLQQENHAKVG